LEECVALPGQNPALHLGPAVHHRPAGGHRWQRTGPPAPSEM